MGIFNRKSAQRKSNRVIFSDLSADIKLDERTLQKNLEWIKRKEAKLAKMPERKRIIAELKLKGLDGEPKLRMTGERFVKKTLEKPMLINEIKRILVEEGVAKNEESAELVVRRLKSLSGVNYYGSNFVPRKLKLEKVHKKGEPQYKLTLRSDDF